MAISVAQKPRATIKYRSRRISDICKNIQFAVQHRGRVPRNHTVRN